MAAAPPLADKSLGTKSPGTMRGRAERLAGVLPPLLVAADRVASTVYQGVHGRRRTGTGDAFWQFRRYQAGDSVGRIDWRQSARSRHVFIRETEWEAVQTVWLWRDGSASMDYASGRDAPTKRQHADLLTLALACLLARGGERVALAGSGDPPGIGGATLDRIARRLERETGPELPADPIPRHGHLVMIGDFLMPLDAVRAAVGAQAARGVRGLILQVLDPAECDLPFRGRIRFEGLEDEGRLTLRRVESLREAYQARLAAHQAELADIAAAAGWQFGRARTDTRPEATLLWLFGLLAGRIGSGA